MSREIILQKIRAATAGITHKAELPDYDSAELLSASKLAGNDLWDIFSRNFKAVNGKPMETSLEIISFLLEKNQTRGYCDPSLTDLIATLRSSGIEVSSTFERARYDEYQFGITLATGAVAESGSLILDDFLTSDRLAALAPWTHIAVLKKENIHRSIPDAIAALNDAPNIIWVTGPSKTADVEGILIEGVHGPGEQIALLM